MCSFYRALRIDDYDAIFRIFVHLQFFFRALDSYLTLSPGVLNVVFVITVDIY